MPDQPSQTMPVSALRVGVFVHLELGWLDHPFPFGSFKITSQQQIDTIRGLGLKEVRWDPAKTEPPAEPAQAATLPNGSAPPQADAPPSPEEARKQQRHASLQAQRLALQQCERRYAEGARAYRQIQDDIAAQPQAAKERSVQLVGGMVAQMLGDEESAIRLLSEGQGERASLHAMNVTVLSLLLGKAMGLPAAQLEDLGVAALLHDMGKAELPDRVRHRDDTFTAAHHKLYQEHVAHGVALGKRMGLSPMALLAISQHHELADGSGFPIGCKADRMAPISRILALINRYDGLCNPPNPLKALTPHEALSLIFATLKVRFESTVLNAFIRMMGVYPPGSLVELTDGRYAMVVSVNSSRPLKPKVLAHDRGMNRDDALLLDLQGERQLGVLRSLRADQLPRASLEFLAPRQRVCYYFERASATESGESPA